MRTNPFLEEKNDANRAPNSKNRIDIFLNPMTSVQVRNFKSAYMIIIATYRFYVHQERKSRYAIRKKNSKGARRSTR